MTGIMAALLCILGPLSIPIGVIPFSLSPLAILFSVYLLGMKRGTLSVLVYLFIGLVGVPVFSGFAGGVGKLFGPTGGFLIGFLPMALIAGWFIDRFYSNIILQAVGMVLGLAVLYAFGTIWLMVQTGLSVEKALAVAVLPFVGADLIKLVIAGILGRILRTGLSKAGLLETKSA